MKVYNYDQGCGGPCRLVSKCPYPSGCIQEPEGRAALAQQVQSLKHQGLFDREIAARLQVSPRTVQRLGVRP